MKKSAGFLRDFIAGAFSPKTLTGLLGWMGAFVLLVITRGKIELEPDARLAILFGWTLVLMTLGSGLMWLLNEVAS